MLFNDGVSAAEMYSAKLDGEIAMNI